VSASMFSGRRRLSTVPSGRAANASFVGAVIVFKNRHKMICECTHDLYSFLHIIIYVPNTVRGPSPERASTRSAAVRAATRVEKSGLPTAMSTIPWH